MSGPGSRSPFYEELAALVVDLTAQLQRAHGRIAELEARLGRDSTQPPSADSIAAKARQRADHSSRERSPDRKPGGQPGRKGSGLAPSTEPDRTETVAAPAECAGCGEDLGEAVDAGVGWAQVWDIPPISLQKVHYLLLRRRCGCCGKITTAVPPFGAAGTVAHGPKVNAAAIGLGIEGNVPVEGDRDADGGVAFRPGVDRVRCPRCGPLRRAAGRGRVRRGDEVALRAEEVLCGDETPTNVLRKDTDAHGEPVAGSPHAVTVRTPDARLVSYAPNRFPVQGRPQGAGCAGGLHRLHRLPGP